MKKKFKINAWWIVTSLSLIIIYLVFLLSTPSETTGIINEQPIQNYKTEWEVCQDTFEFTEVMVSNSIDRIYDNCLNDFGTSQDDVRQDCMRIYLQQVTKSIRDGRDICGGK